MKIEETYQEAPVFRPRALTLTFETQAEMDIFAALFLHVNVCDTLRCVSTIDPAQIRVALENLGAKKFRYWRQAKNNLSR